MRKLYHITLVLIKGKCAHYQPSQTQETVMSEQYSTMDHDWTVTAAPYCHIHHLLLRSNKAWLLQRFISRYTYTFLIADRLILDRRLSPTSNCHRELTAPRPMHFENYDDSGLMIWRATKFRIKKLLVLFEQYAERDHNFKTFLLKIGHVSKTIVNLILALHCW